MDCCVIFGSLGRSRCGHRRIERATAREEPDDRLDIAKDFLRKHQLEAAENECEQGDRAQPQQRRGVRRRAAWSRWSARVDTQQHARDRRLPDRPRRRGDAEGPRRVPHEGRRRLRAGRPSHARLRRGLGEPRLVHNLLEDYATARRRTSTKALENPMRLHQPGADPRQPRLGAVPPEQAASMRPRSCARSMQFQPKMCVATYRLARVYFAREEWEKAAELFQTASATRPAGRRKPATT